MCDSKRNILVNGELKSNLGNFTVDLEGIQIVEEKSELIEKRLALIYLKYLPILYDCLRNQKQGR